MLRCYAYCNSKSYDMLGLEQYFTSKGYIPKKIDEAIHILGLFENSFIEFFFFQFGVVVIWDADRNQQNLHKQACRRAYAAAAAGPGKGLMFSALAISSSLSGSWSNNIASDLLARCHVFAWIFWGEYLLWNGCVGICKASPKIVARFFVEPDANRSHFIVAAFS